jgi:hypothetical protein
MQPPNAKRRPHHKDAGPPSSPNRIVTAEPNSDGATLGDEEEPKAWWEQLGSPRARDFWEQADVNWEAAHERAMREHLGLILWSRRQRGLRPVNESHRGLPDDFGQRFVSAGVRPT